MPFLPQISQITQILATDCTDYGDFFSHRGHRLHGRKSGEQENRISGYRLYGKQGIRPKNRRRDSEFFPAFCDKAGHNFFGRSEARLTT